MHKEQYLNREKKLYEYIKTHRNDDGLAIFSDQEAVNEFDVHRITIQRWKSKLKQLGLITWTVKTINNKHVCLYKTIEE